jgi:hypothetical protein
MPFQGASGDNSLEEVKRDMPLDIRGLTIKFEN